METWESEIPQSFPHWGNREPDGLKEMNITLFLSCLNFVPVFLPGESQGQRSLMGCCLWGCTELVRKTGPWCQKGWVGPL